MTKSQFLIISLLAGVITAFSVITLPGWIDDCWIWMIVTEEGAGAVRPNMADRPLVGAIWGGLARVRALWIVSTAVHWACWTAMGAVTAILWSRLFPRWRRYSLSAACLSLSPALFKVHCSLVSITWAAHLGVILTYLAVLTLLSDFNSRRKAVAAHGMASMLVFVSILLSEYALSVLLGGVILLIGRALLGRQWFAIASAGLLLTVGATAYDLYQGMADPEAHRQVRLDSALSNSRQRGARIVSDLVEVTNYGAVRGPYHLAKEIAQEIPGLISWRRVNKSLLMGWLAGMAVAAIVYREWTSSQRGPMTMPVLGRGGWPSITVLVAAFTASLFPVVWICGLDMIPTYDSSRFWLPALPLVSCLSVALACGLLRSRLRRIIPVACGFLVGYGTVRYGAWLASDFRRMDRWGDKVERFVSEEGEGITIAVFSGLPKDRIRDLDLTIGLTKGWPESKRKRFLAYPSYEASLPMVYEKGVIVRWWITERDGVPWNVFFYRGVTRTGRIDQFLRCDVASMELEKITQVEDFDDCRPPAERNDYHSGGAGAD